MPPAPISRRAQPRHGRTCPWIDVRCPPAGHDAHAGGANENELLHPARYEQNNQSIALGRKSWLFAGSERGGERAAIMYTLIQTAKMNGLDPEANLADVIARIADHPANRIDELLP